MKTITRGAVAAVIAVTAIVGTVSPALAAPPVPSTVMTCAKLQSATDPRAAFDVPVALHAPAVQDVYYQPSRLPGSDIIRMAGGLECQWSNGGELDVVPDPETFGVRVQFLPGGSAGYDASWWGPPPIDPEVTFCDGSGYCELTTNVGGDYLRVWVDRARDDTVALDLAHRISTALQLGLQTPYTPPTYATPLHHTCAQLIRPTVFRAAIGTSAVLEAVGGPWDMDVVNTARSMTGAVDCFYGDAFSPQTAGFLQTMPGGRWAFLTLRSRLTTPGPLTAVTVPGMRAGDSAFTRCDPGHEHCMLDALIATHWIEVELPAVSPGATLIRRDRHDALVTLLRELVLQVYTP